MSWRADSSVNFRLELHQQGSSLTGLLANEHRATVDRELRMGLSGRIEGDSVWLGRPPEGNYRGTYFEGRRSGDMIVGRMVSPHAAEPAPGSLRDRPGRPPLPRHVVTQGAVRWIQVRFTRLESKDVP